MKDGGGVHGPFRIANRISTDREGRGVAEAFLRLQGGRGQKSQHEEAPRDSLDTGDVARLIN